MLAEWRVRRAGLDYHVDVERHYYSVPYRFAREAVEVRLTARTVEIFARGERIAAHVRNSGNGRHTIMPSSARQRSWPGLRAKENKKAGPGRGPASVVRS